MGGRHVSVGAPLEQNRVDEVAGQVHEHPRSRRRSRWPDTYLESRVHDPLHPDTAGRTVTAGRTDPDGGRNDGT
jgi:hypothetical protein